LLASLKGAGGAWSEPTAPAAIAGEPAVRLYFNLDRSAKDLASDFHFRALERAVHRAKPAVYLNDPRDKLISLDYTPLVR
jgi:hypothetical protein